MEIPQKTKCKSTISPLPGIYTKDSISFYRDTSLAVSIASLSLYTQKLGDGINPDVHQLMKRYENLVQIYKGILYSWEEKLNYENFR